VPQASGPVITDSKHCPNLQVHWRTEYTLYLDKTGIEQPFLFFLFANVLLWLDKKMTSTTQENKIIYIIKHFKLK
jgi:hypothetical protein